jgi:hypothetical protein
MVNGFLRLRPGESSRNPRIDCIELRSHPRAMIKLDKLEEIEPARISPAWDQS